MGIPGYLTRYCSRVPYIYIRSCARSISENTHARNRTCDLYMASHIAELPDLTKSPSERYKLSVCIKGSCTTCIQAALYNFMACSCPNFVLGHLKKKKKQKKKNMEKITVFPFSVYTCNSSDVF